MTSAKPRTRALARGRDPGWIAVLALIVLACVPLLRSPTVPTATDIELHVYRAWELAEQWRAGDLVARWAPDFAYGYGYPVFVYYAPLTYILGGLATLALPGADAGVKAVQLLIVALGATGAYGLGRRVWGSAGGLGTCAAFVFAPYILYVNPIARGAVPESLALALIPWVWWLGLRAGSQRDWASVAAMSVAAAALLCAHNLLSALGLALALPVWWLILGKPSGFRFPLLALLFSVGLSAWFWLPAAWMREAVEAQRAFEWVRSPDATLSWVPLSELLAPLTLDAAQSPQPEAWPIQIGWLQVIVAGAGLITLLATRERRRLGLGLLGLIVALAFPILPESRALWNPAGPLILLQLPWRLLGPLALLLALLGGAAIAQLATRLPRGWPIAWLLVLVGLIVSVEPVLIPIGWADFGPVTLDRIWASESAGNIGGTSQNEFLPVTVHAMPGPAPDLQESMRAGAPDPIDRAALPAGVTVTRLERDTYAVSAPEPFTLTVRRFAFPGWEASLDYQPAPFTISDPEGFIRIDLPAGASHLKLARNATPIEWAAWAITGLAGLSLGLSRWFLAPAITARRLEARNASSGVPVGVTLIAVLGVGVWISQPVPSIQVPAEPALARLGDAIELVGADVSATQVSVGETVTLTLTWRSIAPAPRDLSVFVHVLAADGTVVAQSDKIRPVVAWPTDRWPIGRSFTDQHLLALPVDLAPGRYRVAVGLWDRLTGARQPVEGSPDGLATITELWMTTPD